MKKLLLSALIAVSALPAIASTADDTWNSTKYVNKLAICSYFAQRLAEPKSITYKFISALINEVKMKSSNITDSDATYISAKLVYYVDTKFSSATDAQVNYRYNQFCTPMISQL